MKGPTSKILLAAVLAIALGGLAPAAGQAKASGTWMAGPGCGGKYEWLQHPGEFPYFCDGAAYVEGAHWQSWGKAKARATATLNEALLNSHNSVGSAPRQRTPVTIVASHVKRCGGRRAYTSIVIHLMKDRGGPRTLKLASLLPPCSKSPSGASPLRAAEFYARPAGGSISCGMYAEPSARQVICQSYPLTGGEAAPDTIQHLARLRPDGRFSACSQPLGEGDDHCRAGNVGERTPTYAPGKRVEVGPFACSVLEAGVECTLTASGKGFLITPGEITPVGG